MMDPVLLIVVGVVGLLIGFLLSNLVASLRAEEKPRPPTEPVPEDRIEIIRIWRKREGSALLPEMDGETLSSAARLSAEQHARISMALVDLYAWLERGGQPTPALEDIRKATAGSSTSAAPAPLESASGSSAPGEAAPLERPSLNPLRSLMRAARKEVVDKMAAAPPSIAEQVNEILQDKLHDSPLADRGIRLMELPGKGMVILIGLDKYESVEAVPDEDIREMIRAAVAEWENRKLADRS